MSDQVREYLRSRNYADHVVRGGLQGLVLSWEHVVDRVVEGKGIVFERDEYLNDMDGRRILEEALQVAPTEDSSRWALRVQAADEKIRPHLIPSDECIWGDDKRTQVWLLEGT